MIWSELNLIEVADVFNGMTPSKIEQRIQGYPVLKIKDVSDNRKFRGVFESFVDIGLANKFKSKFIKLNDTLILNAAHNADYVGSKQYRAESEVVNSLPTGEWLIVRGDSNKVDSVYLNFWLRLDATRFKIRNLVKGIHLYPKDVARLKIPLPPLAEQQKIASILDAADSLRQKDQQLIEKYNALSQSLFLEMFGDPETNPMGWDVEPFDYFASIDTQMTTDFLKYANVPHIGIANIEKNTGMLINYRLVKDENLTSGKYIFTPEHIIYSKIRPNLNKVALPNFNGLSSADSYPILVHHNKANKLFFTYILRSAFFLDFILQHSTRTNIPKANKSQMRLFKGIAPPISLQNKFGERIQSIEAQKQLAQTSLEKSAALFNSLLQRAFKGELTA